MYTDPGIAITVKGCVKGQGGCWFSVREGPRSPQNLLQLSSFVQSGTEDQSGTYLFRDAVADARGFFKTCQAQGNMAEKGCVSENQRACGIKI